MTFSPIASCTRAFAVLLVTGALAGCTDRTLMPARTTSVEINFQGPVELRPDMRPPMRPASLDTCVTATVVTRLYPSWRDYASVPMSAAVTLDSWRLTFIDVPVGETVRFRINDKNWCDRSALGAVLSDVTVNGVPLTQNTTTPGPAGEEPGFAFTIDASGQVRQ